MKTKLTILLICTVAFCGCNKPTCDNRGFVNCSSFEEQFTTLGFNPSPDFHYDVVENPHRRGINRSSRCGMIITAGDPWEYVVSDKLSRKLDFTAQPPILKMKVLAPRKGCKVYMKLEPEKAGEAPAIEVQNVINSCSGVWEELIFDFGRFNPQSNRYRKIVLLFDAGTEGVVGEKWYFDDIMIPDDDLTSISLFQRYEGNPIFAPEGENNWRDSHIANAAVLPPDLSPDGNWWLFIRGSGHTPDYHDQIGIFTQNADEFKPFGPWTPREDNPVMHYGAVGEYDEWHLLDCAPVVGKDGTIYFYYLGRKFDNTPSLGVRYSTDGGKTFRKADDGQPFRESDGCCDALYHDGQYYILSSRGRITITTNPLSSKDATVVKALTTGGAPSNFDDHAFHGMMVFRLTGVDKWFMAYQGSAINNDFPDRFHIALSDDLIHWEKVQNPQPLFTRGSAGEWDQGGIWYPAIFEYGDRLYLYYEGWGRKGYVADRNRPYFSGRSCTGAASASKDDFLRWCNINQ